MAEAAAKTITWILLREALDLVVAHWQSRGFSEKLLAERLREGKVHARAHLEAYRGPPNPGIDDAEFWREEYGDKRRVRLLWISWDESSALRREFGSLDRYAARRIEVVREEVLAQLPAAPAVAPTPPPPRSNIAFLGAEIARMKAAGDISTDTKKAALSRILEPLLRKAAADNPNLTPQGARTIANGLTAWGLFPI